MYLTKLLLNPLSRQVVRDLANPYELHRSLLSVFPDANDGGPGRVLFRVESRPSSDWYDDEPPAPVVLVQSEHAPDWNNSKLDRDYFRERLPSKLLSQQFAVGTSLRFRLRANPTKKLDGKRHGLFHEDAQRAWLKRKAMEFGFDADLDRVAVLSEGNSQGTKRNGQRYDITHFAVRFDGELIVTDAAKFAEALRCGIGSAKGFGFGLLSVARASS